MTKKVSVTLPDGRTATRRSPRPYTHALVAREVRKYRYTDTGAEWYDVEPRWCVVSWHQGPENARKGLAAGLRNTSAWADSHQLIATDLPLGRLIAMAGPLVLSCSSCPWTWRGHDDVEAERASASHMAENGHAVNDSEVR